MKITSNPEQDAETWYEEQTAPHRDPEEVWGDMADLWEDE